jgi:hypothetical protein
MRRWIFSIASLTLALTGCNDGKNDQCSILESPVLSRPIVAIVPVLDHSHSKLSWDVSNELSHGIRQRIAQKNHLYLAGEEAVISLAKRAFAAHDPFGLDTSWVKKSFPQAEFVVFMELLEHNEVAIYAAKDLQDSPAELNISVRLRVFDVRDQTPKVVLQEIVQQTHHVPKHFNKANFSQAIWGDEIFEISPLGVAHDVLCKEISSRIEDYILLSGR